MISPCPESPESSLPVARPSAPGRQWLAWILPLLLLLVLPVCVAIRIQTYATGQDPRIFIALARDLILHVKSLSGVAAVIVPGWPLVLAAVIRLFGMHAAFWINLPLFLLAMLLLARLLSDLFASAVRGTFAALLCTMILLGGHTQNPHFLLWSFRQTPIYLLSLLALFSVRRAGLAAALPGGSRLRASVWLLVSLLALGAATTVRETSPLVFPAMFLYLAFCPLTPAGTAPRRGARAFLLWTFPALCTAIAIAVVALLLLLRISPFNAQNEFFLRWFQAMFTQDFCNLPLWSMLRILRAEFTLPGLAVLALGTALSFSRRYRPFLFLFGIPALSYLVFDGLLKVHVRFILSTLFFAAPIAALGAAEAFSAVLRLVRRFRARGIPPPSATIVPALGAAAILAVWSFAVLLPGIRAWGPRISRADVRRLLDVLAPCVPASGKVVVDPRHRYIQDIITAFSPWSFIEARSSTPPEVFLADPPLPYIQSLSPRAAYASVIATPASDILEEIADLSTVETFTIGGVPYDLVLLEPPRATSRSFDLPPPPPSLRSPPPPAVFLRLSMPASCGTNPVSAVLNGRLLATNLPPGRACIPVPTDLLPTHGEPPASDGDRITLQLSAPAPFPAAVRPAWIFPDAPLFIGFGSGVLPSTDHCLSPDFTPYLHIPDPDPAYPSWPVSPHAREFKHSATVSIPAAPATGTPCPAHLVIGLSALRREMSAFLDVSIDFPEFPGIPPITQSAPHSDRCQFFSFVTPPLPAPPSSLRLSVSTRNLPPPSPLEAVNPRLDNVRLFSVSCAPLFPFSSLAVEFSRSGDDALLLSGFFMQENPDTPGGGRWIAPEATLLLPPFSGTGPRRISLLADVSAMPAGISPSLVFELPGLSLPATSEVDSGNPRLRRFSATIPEGTLSENLSTPLAFAVTPAFRPSDYGSADSRALGLFLKSFSIAPADAPAPPPRP